MMSLLKVINLPPEAENPISLHPSSFILHTCQRRLIVSTRLEDESLPQIVYRGQEGYQYLLEIISGLRSKIVAEDEIIRQFKDAYNLYLQQECRDSFILKVLQKLFQDAKEIRTQYLSKLGQLSYANITKKLLIDENSDHKILILGSGVLAKSLINTLRKRYELFISARDAEKVEKLCSKYSVSSVLWKDHQQYLSFSTIINTIGANSTILHHKFFLHWFPENRLFVDLSVPSTTCANLENNKGIYRLNDLLQRGIDLNSTQGTTIDQSRLAIVSLAQKRSLYFTNRTARMM